MKLTASFISKFAYPFPLNSGYVATPPIPAILRKAPFMYMSLGMTATELASRPPSKRRRMLEGLKDDSLMFRSFKKDDLNTASESFTASFKSPLRAGLIFIIDSPRKIRL